MLYIQIDKVIWALHFAFCLDEAYIDGALRNKAAIINLVVVSTLKRCHDLWCEDGARTVATKYKHMSISRCWIASALRPFCIDRRLQQQRTNKNIKSRAMEEQSHELKWRAWMHNIVCLANSIRRPIEAIDLPHESNAIKPLYILWRCKCNLGGITASAQCQMILAGCPCEYCLSSIANSSSFSFVATAAPAKNEWVIGQWRSEDTFFRT